MVDITEFTWNELLKDLKESLDDIWVCAQAVQISEVYGSENRSIQDRIDGNQMIVDRILSEIKRRKG